jgi:Ser/Thr protein kinase RdoA (MazF antagonist)
VEFSEHEIGRLLGSGQRADVYEYGDLALKLYQPGISKGPAFREAANLAVLEGLSLPTPAVHAVGDYRGRWGVLMDRAPGQRFADQMSPAAMLEAMAGLHRRIHEQPGHGLPSLKARLSANIRRADALDTAARDRLLHRLQALPDGDRVCHGDFHPWNIHGTREDPTVLDWLDACAGDPAADVCRTYVLLHHVSPVMAADYVKTYAGMAGLNEAEIPAWLPVVAAARLAEGVEPEKASLLRLALAAED